MDMQGANSDVPEDRATRELRILIAVAEALNSTPDVRGALQQTLGLVGDLLGLQTGWIWLRDPDTDLFYSAAAQNLPPYLRESLRMTGKPCWCIQSFLARRLTPENIDVLECSRLLPAVRAGKVDATQGLRYHASIPLYFRDQPLGIMNITGPDYRRLRKDELRLLSSIAAQVGAAIERARLGEAGTQLARAQERERFSREIHDTLAQGLTAIALNLEGALNQIDRDPQRVRERLQRALDMTRESLEEARRSVLDLRSGALTRPLPDALDALARRFTAETGVRVRVHSDGTLALPLRAESELYRIAQEALANIRHHAEASEADVTLACNAREVRLSIHDNGTGFDTRVRPAGHHGILGMQERAKLLGGKLQLASSAGNGTTVTAIVPLPSAETP